MENEIKEDKKKGMEFFKDVYKKYAKKCIRKNVMDFGDLIINTLDLFENNQSILAEYQNKFKYILIDEFQDTNKTQYEIVKKLSNKSHNICAVGDDYQSIYSFLGTDINNIIIFKDCEGTKTDILSQNYRSNSTIVKVANLLIKNNKNQTEKNSFSEIKETDGKVNILVIIK